MFVLGIDPGLSRCGYCVVERGRSGVRAASLGVLRTGADEPIPQRLAALQNDVRDLLREFSPSVVAVERVLFQVNVRTAMGVGQASGLVMAEAVQAGAEVHEYSPNQVKEAVTGWGAAPKEQVQQMVQSLLGLTTLPEPADAADAAAVALCHLAWAGTPLGGTHSTGPSPERAPGAVRNRVRRQEVVR